MKRILMLLSIFSICLFAGMPFVKADNGKCTIEQQNQINKEAQKIKTSYEFVYEGETVKGFKIYIYNVPDNMSVRYSTNSKKYSISGSVNISDGTGYIEDNNTTDIYTYKFEVYSTLRDCSYKVTTTSLTKPKYNKYSENVYCSYEGLDNVRYCNEWIDREFDISSEEIEKLMDSNITKTTTTEPTTSCLNCNNGKFRASLKNFYKKYRMTFIIGIIMAMVLDIFTIVLLVRESKGGDL